MPEPHAAALPLCKPTILEVLLDSVQFFHWQLGHAALHIQEHIRDFDTYNLTCTLKG